MATQDDQLVAEKTGTTQARAFAATELVACPACSRSNPPTRANCLYCGAPLGTSVEPAPSTASVGSREAESESLVNIVLNRTGWDGHELSAEFAQLFNLSADDLNLLLNGTVAPLYSAATPGEAHTISEKLRATGVEPITVSDEQLAMESPPKQIAALGITDSALTASVRRTGERISARWDDVALIVMGRLYFTTNEVEQKRDKSKKVLDERQLTSDEAVFDVYLLSDDCGWRVRAGSFDFSCLGSDMKPTAFENFNALKDLLQRNAANSVFDDGYIRMRSVLNKVWPLESRPGATERRHTPTREINATATTSNNELQFTRYSRLLRFFQTADPQDDARQSQTSRPVA